MTLSGSVRIHGESGTAEQRPAFSVFIFPVREVLNFTGPCQSSDREGADRESFNSFRKHSDALEKI